MTARIVGTFRLNLALQRLRYFLPVLCLVLLSTIGSSAQTSTPGAGYWHTKGSQILDSNNQPVRIAGVNWYGFETNDLVALGLTKQDYKTILQTIKGLGYNTIRLPFSNQMIESPIVPGAISYDNGSAINTDLKGLNSLQIMDAIIAECSQLGLRVILDNHRSEAGNGAEASGLWYTDAYSETAWIFDWQNLATRYLGNQTVIGFDLRNEPHNASSGGSCWSCGTAANDWHLAATRAGNAVLNINPNLLVFVEGTDTVGADSYFWGGNLEGVQADPVKLSVDNQLVYSAHEYGPKEYQESWFNASTSDDSLSALWLKTWGYISANNIAPVWIGEFGTPNTDSDAQDSVSGSQGQWFSSVIGYLRKNPNLSWTYWAVNGEDLYAVLDSKYDAAPVDALKQSLLASVQFPLTGTSATTGPTLTISSNPNTVTAASSSTDTGSGGTVTQATYTAVVSNHSASAVSNVSVTLQLPTAAAVISEAGTGTGANCAAGSAAGAYTCTFASVAPSAQGGVVATVVYPQAALNFGSAQSVTEAVTASGSVGANALTSSTTGTVVNGRGQNSNTYEYIAATPLPGYSFNYGTAATVNFALQPAPSTAIPATSFSAIIDGSTGATISQLGANSYQIQAVVLSGGNHSVVISMPAGNGYSASSSSVTLSVQKANAILNVPTSPSIAYGAPNGLMLTITGIPGNTLAAPTGSVQLSVDGSTAQISSINAGNVAFTLPASTKPGAHTATVIYMSDTNYQTQTKTFGVTVTVEPLIVTVADAKRAVNAANPTFTATLNGLVYGDTTASLGITYSTTATVSSPAGTYPITATASTAPNYVLVVTPGTLTITTDAPPAITWLAPASITYGAALTATQLNATGNVPMTLVYTPALGTVLNAGLQTLSVIGTPANGTAAVKASVQIMVQQAVTTTTLVLPSSITTPYLMSATVKGSGGGPLAGSFRFMDNGTVLDTEIMPSTGIISYSLPSVPVGNHGYYAIYLGDSNNLASQSDMQSVTGIGGDFTLTGSPATLPLTAGQSGTVMLTVTPNGGLTGSIALACTGLPTGSSCTFSPATVTADGQGTLQTSKVTIILPGTTSSMSPLSIGGGHSNAALAALLFGLPLSTSMLALRRRRIKLAVLLLCGGFAFGLTGCAANNAYTGSTTQVGSYTATITATAGSVSHSTTLSIGLNR